MKNPIIEGNYADPDAAVFDGKVYIYPTTDHETWSGSVFKVFSSKDMKEWKDEGVILDLADVPWTGGIRAWAPAICEKNGKYYFYYSGNLNIGVAVSDRPTGPFVDVGAPIVAKGEYDCALNIDPYVFIDDDGQAYLYWGNAKMYVAKLAENMTEFAEEPIDITPSDYTEAPCIFKRKGIYYYSWSKGDTRLPDYHVRYAKGTSPTERPGESTPILHCDFADDKRIKCTGHHAVINIPGTDEWYVVYHRFSIEKYGDCEEFSTEEYMQREVCIDRMYFDDDGNILPIKPTN